MHAGLMGERLGEGGTQVQAAWLEASALPHCVPIQELQYWYLSVACLLLTAITLPLDGTDWGVMAAWTPADWLVLVLLGSIVFVGLAFALQVSKGPSGTAVADLATAALLWCLRNDALPAWRLAAFRISAAHTHRPSPLSPPPIRLHSTPCGSWARPPCH